MSTLTQIQLRRDLAANWTAANVILAAGEFAYELDTKQFKIGDGVTVWTLLPYTLAGISGGLTPHGTSVAPIAVTASGGVSTLGVSRELQFIVGSPGAVVVSANPRVTAGTKVGQELILQGTDNTKTVTLATGNGLDLNGSVVLAAGSRIYLAWDGTNWGEVSRK